MFQKMKSRKGFTLIEMLVVIAIIAVLVAIVVPVVGNSTTKARAAADAANLRTVAASAAIAILDGKTDITANSLAGTDLPSGGNIEPKSSFASNAKLTVYVVNDEIVVTFGAYTIEDFTDTAESGNAPAAGSYATVPQDAIMVFQDS